MPATILANGIRVDLDPLRVTRADVVLRDGRIADPKSPLPTSAAIDCSGCVVVPGLVVGHTHFYSALAAGMPGPKTPPATFREILERVWWRLDQALDEASIRASAEVAALSAIKAGVTLVFDHHESPRFIDGSLDVIQEALEAVGLRGVLTYGATNRHGPEGARAGLAESERFIAKTRDGAEARGMIGLHAPFTCADQTLEAASEAARRSGAGLHLHAAEGPDDQVAAKTRWNAQLLPHLDRIGLLGEKTLLAHAVDISDDEARLAGERRTWIAHQPRSNMNNAVGYAKRLAQLERVALGTDGIDQDVLAELKMAFFRRREAFGPNLWPDPVALLSRGHRLASEIFGQRFGALEEGAPGDVVVLEYDSPTPIDAAGLGAHLIFGISSLHVRDVFVAGRPVLRRGRAIQVDEARVAARAREAAVALWGRMAAL